MAPSRNHSCTGLPGAEIVEPISSDLERVEYKFLPPALFQKGDHEKILGCTCRRLVRSLCIARLLSEGHAIAPNEKLKQAGRGHLSMREGDVVISL